MRDLKKCLDLPVKSHKNALVEIQVRLYKISYMGVQHRLGKLGTTAKHNVAQPPNPIHLLLEM